MPPEVGDCSAELAVFSDRRDTTCDVKSSSDDSNQTMASLDENQSISSSTISPTNQISAAIAIVNNVDISAFDVCGATAKPTELNFVNIKGDNSNKRLPTIEDLCMKDTKTLNTNVLAMEFSDDVIAMDSHKYHKPDNTNRPSDDDATTNLAMTADDVDAAASITSLADKCDDDDDPMKGESLKSAIKETNFLANQKVKFSDDSCSGGKKLFSELFADDQELIQIKRIKIDEQGCSDWLNSAHAQVKDTNARMQQVLKINTDKNALFHDSNNQLLSAAAQSDATAAGGGAGAVSVDESNANDVTDGSAQCVHGDAQIMNNARPLVRPT